MKKKKTFTIYIEKGLASMYASAQIGDHFITATAANEKELIPLIQEQLQTQLGLKENSYELVLRNA